MRSAQANLKQEEPAFVVLIEGATISQCTTSLNSNLRSMKKTTYSKLMMIKFLLTSTTD